MARTIKSGIRAVTPCVLSLATVLTPGPSFVTHGAESRGPVKQLYGEPGEFVATPSSIVDRRWLALQVLARSKTVADSIDLLLDESSFVEDFVLDEDVATAITDVPIDRVEESPRVELIWTELDAELISLFDDEADD